MSTKDRAPLSALAAIFNGNVNIIFPIDLEATVGQFVDFKIYKREQGTVQNALRGKKYIKTEMGSVKLPLPANLGVNYQVDYQNEELGITGSLILAGGAAAFKTADKAIEDAFAASAKAGFAGDASLLKKAAAGAGAAVNTFADAAKGAAVDILKQIEQGAALDTTKAALGAFALRRGGANIKSIGADVKGIAANPHRVVLLQGVTFREHRFSYRLSPKNREESTYITKMITLFKYHMHPEFGGGGEKFAKRAFLEYPEIFQISFHAMHAGKGSGHNHLFKCKPCVLKSMAVNYHPMGYPGYIRTEDDVAPVEVQIDLSFQEIEMVDKKFILDEADDNIVKREERISENFGGL